MQDTDPDTGLMPQQDLLIGQLLHGALLILLTRRTLEHPTLLPPSHDALHSWRELIGLGFGAAVGLWAEWWSGEVMIVMAGLAGPTHCFG